MGGKGSGGPRPTAPQNNFAISATGGAGNTGQPKRYIPGLGYGQGQATMDMQGAAPMEQAPEPTAAPMPHIPIFAPTQRPNEPVTHGSDAGPGADSSILNLPAISPNAVQDTTGNTIRALYAQDPQNEDLRLLVKSLDEAGR